MPVMQMVASREIRSAARLPRTYWIRTAAGAAGVFVLATFGTDDSRTMFFRSVITAFALCLLEGVRLASSAIVDERNEGTLGLLLLTKLRGDELLLGKLAALGFFSLQTLMVVVPVLCVSLVFGGVSAGEIARAALGLAHALLIALTCGLVISARSRTAARAMIKTFFALFAAVFAFSIAWRIGGKTELLFTALNPMTPIWTIPDLEYAPVKTEYWVSIFFSITVALFVLREAGCDLSKYFALEEATAKEPPQRDEWAEKYRELVIGKERAQWFSGNPIEWLALRNMGSNSRWRRRITVIGAVLVSFALLGIRTQAPPWILLIGIVFGFIYSVSSAMTFARARQTNEIEMWLTTPLTLNEIVNGHIAAMRKTFLWPGLILIGGWAAIFCSLVLRHVMTGDMQIGVFIPGVGEFMSFSAAVYLLVCSILAMASLLSRFHTSRCGSPCDQNVPPRPQCGPSSQWSFVRGLSCWCQSFCCSSRWDASREKKWKRRCAILR